MLKNRLILTAMMLALPLAGLVFFGLLTLITAVEVAMGVFFKRSETFTWTAIKWTFIIMTLVKAAYIVLVFMHLGDERSNLKRAVIAPYVLFICYLIFIAITEGLAHYDLDLLFH